MKGKHGNAAANRRAEQAAAETARLCEALAAAETRRAEETAALRAEVVALQGRLSREVRDLAAEEIKRLTGAHADELARERERARERINRAMIFLRDNSTGLTLDHWASLGEIVGVRIGELLAVTGVELNRTARRTTNPAGHEKARQMERAAPHSFYRKPIR